MLQYRGLGVLHEQYIVDGGAPRGRAAGWSSSTKSQNGGTKEENGGTKEEEAR